MKKVMRMLVVAMMCCGVLTGCGKNEEVTEEAA